MRKALSFSFSQNAENILANTKNNDNELHIAKPAIFPDNIDLEDLPTTSKAAAVSAHKVNTTENITKTATDSDAKNKVAKKYVKLIEEKKHGLNWLKKERLLKIAAHNLRKQFKQNISPRNYAWQLRQKLHAGKQQQPLIKPNRNKSFKLNKMNTTGLEEGEVISDSSCNDDDDDDADDDCILVENSIEEVAMPDDEKSITSLSSQSFMSFLDHHTASNATSTPAAKKMLQNNPTSSNNNNENNGSQINNPIVNEAAINYDDDNEILPYYVDTTAVVVPASSAIDIVDNTNVSTANNRSSRKRRSKSLRRNLPTIDNEAVIVIDDTIDTTEQPQKRQTDLNDSSVIFVSETHPSKPSFIPLEDDTVPNPLSVPTTPKRQCYKSDDLFTSVERKKLQVYNDNTYNPNPTKEKNGNKRVIVIDGSNVAYGHSRCKNFSVKGVEICIEYFEKMGHEVKCVVPIFRQNRFKSTQPEVLQSLYHEGKVIYTPCKNLPGLSSTSYDDRFILQIASQLDAAIISNDNYRDLINENEAFKKIIENRVIGYTWCNDMFILPKDPYGRNGPSLYAILNCR